MLEHLAPQSVFAFFEEICAIPHGSGNMRAISDYCLAFAEKRGLRAHRDENLNVIIFAPATPGYERAQPLILQAHLDMVCEKVPGSNHDFIRDGLCLQTDGNRIWAKGTTLGADDGIAVAMILAALDDRTLPHPALEAVLTVDEETGMLGAEKLDVSLLKGRRLINLDSEVEGIFTVSCAGGNMADCSLPLYRQMRWGNIYEVKISGLLGGHSGVEIHKGRGNANVLLGRILYAARQEAVVSICALRGGEKDNAIPTAASASVMAADGSLLETLAACAVESFHRELLKTDAGVTVELLPQGEKETAVLTDDTADRLLCMLLCAPNGVQTMSRDIPGLVQTSLNLGSVGTDDACAEFRFCIRSFFESERRMLNDRLSALAACLGGCTTIHGAYPGWAYRPVSPLRERMAKVFAAQYGEAPIMETIHAGLECGLLGGRIADLDTVSIGPDLTAVHTASESVCVASVQRVWQFLLAVLRDSTD